MITYALRHREVRSSMDVQDATVRWVDHSGMCVDAMTKKNGNIPLL